MQSSFPSMADTIRSKPWSLIFPIDLILTKRFNSLAKIRSLKIPVLFIHGTADSIVPSVMSQELYAAAPVPKQLSLIPGAEHVKIYQSGNRSYLRAIERFMITLP